ncbi:MAG: hypothetical protein KatS3mg081_0552 [Gemmatimonadales bacterium]|nr:MAG: hypothetical protein KatS3mg081_0552 [Gemmatimonadales bacterium]
MTLSRPRPLRSLSITQPDARSSGAILAIRPPTCWGVSGQRLGLRPSSRCASSVSSSSAAVPSQPPRSPSNRRSASAKESAAMAVSTASLRCSARAASNSPARQGSAGSQAKTHMAKSASRGNAGGFITGIRCNPTTAASRMLASTSGRTLSISSDNSASERRALSGIRLRFTATVRSLRSPRTANSSIDVTIVGRVNSKTTGSASEYNWRAE